MALEGGLGDGSPLLASEVRRETIREATAGGRSFESDRRRERIWLPLKASLLPGREGGELTGF